MSSPNESTKKLIEAFLTEHDPLINQWRETALQAFEQGAENLPKTLDLLGQLQAVAQQNNFSTLAECLGDIAVVLRSYASDESLLPHLTHISNPWADVIYELSNYFIFMTDEDEQELKQRVGYRLLQLAKALNQVVSEHAMLNPVVSDGSWGIFEPQLESPPKPTDKSWDMDPAEALAEAKPAAVKAVKREAIATPPIEKPKDEAIAESVLATHYLICMLGTQQYALPIHQVREILERRPEKVLPMPRSGIVGLVTVRGLVCPVVDVSKILYAKDDGQGNQDLKKRCMVVCEVDRRTFCFNVDDVRQVASVEEFQDQITPLGSEGNAQKAISHVSHFQDRSVLFVKMREVIPA